MTKIYDIEEYSFDLKRSKHVTGTFNELLDHYSATLENGAKYTGPGKKKVNVSPSTIRGLVSSLNKALQNQSRIAGLQSKKFTLIMDEKS